MDYFPSGWLVGDVYHVTNTEGVCLRRFETRGAGRWRETGDGKASPVWGPPMEVPPIAYGKPYSIGRLLLSIACWRRRMPADAAARSWW